MAENEQLGVKNKQLEALMLEAGFLKADGSVGLKVFARAVSGKHPGGKAFTHTYVRRWLTGIVPRDEQTKNAILRALSERLGRRISVDEAGFGKAPKVSADLGLHYPGSVSDAVGNLQSLWRADLNAAPELLTAPASVAAWNDASLSWLVGARYDMASGSGNRKVTMVDIEGIRDLTSTFDRLDGQHGGGHARRSLLEFLDKDIPGFINGKFTSEVGAELFRAVAQATLLGAWMSYDAGLHGFGQRYFIQALGVAQGADDRLLGASILDAMSHQATFLGKYREAANMTRAAQQGAATAGSHYAMAHFAAMEARSLARLGDASGCDRAMSQAVGEFERCNAETDPADWFSYFNESELNAELGHCNRDLGRSTDATTYASQSLGPTSSGYVRSDFFTTMVLADAYLDQGDVEQACQVALEALEIGTTLKSARCGAYVGEFQDRLKQVGKTPVVADFVERASEYRLWTAKDARKAANPGDRRLT